MKSLSQLRLFALLMLCGIVTVVFAASPTGRANSRADSYFLYTKALHVDESGVVVVPPRFRWSVETSFSGVDGQGKSLPDSRVMLRLYDPDHNFTAMTAQMDLTTAARLHHELGEVIRKKLQDPHYEQRPQLYDPQSLPIGRFKGIDENGRAVVELEYPASGSETAAGLQ